MAKWLTFISVCVMAAALGCGGGSKKEKPTTPTTTSSDADDSTETTQPKPEVTELQLTEIQSMLNRKRLTVSRCFGVALKAGEVNKTDSGYVTVMFNIGTDTKAHDAHVSQATIKSKALSKCVLEHFSLWTFPKLPKQLPYSYRFTFKYF